MRYDFRCGKCAGITELVQPITSALPETIKCCRAICGGDCTQVITAPMISRTGMTHEPFDIAVGRDAEARWADISRRQNIRNQVRKESGAQALVMTGRNEFTPRKGAKLGSIITEPDSSGKGSGPGSSATKKIVADLRKRD